jgi:hypothetical protein
MRQQEVSASPLEDEEKSFLARSAVSSCMREAREKKGPRRRERSALGEVEALSPDTATSGRIMSATNALHTIFANTLWHPITTDLISM